MRVMKKMTNSMKWTAFCAAWISISSSATVDANRRISADGHRATMARLDEHFARMAPAIAAINEGMAKS